MIQDITKLKNEGKGYKFRNGPLFMGDILGFSNYVKTTPLGVVKQKMDNIIYKIENINSIDIIEEFKDRPEIKGKVINILSKEYRLNGHIISDTILIYPNKEIKEENSYLELIIISSMLRVIFEFFLKENLLLRGTLNYGEYYISSSKSKSLYGKNMIEAHEYEQIQDWGGILLSPKVVKKIYLIERESIVQYDVSFIKKEDRDEFVRQYKSNEPYVLAWPSIVKEFNWISLYYDALKIEKEKIRESAIRKINNTIRFYQWYNEYQKKIKS